jgi:hypothetical protein
MAKSGIQADEGKAAHPLDRVVWNALSGPQHHLGEGGPHARRYNPAVAPFAALAALDAASFDALLMLVGPATLVALFTVDEVSFPDGFVVAKRALADQMLLENPAACELTDLDPLGLVTCQRCWSSPTRPNPVLSARRPSNLAAI